MNIYGHLSYHTSTLQSSNAAIAPGDTPELALKQLAWYMGLEVYLGCLMYLGFNSLSEPHPALGWTFVSRQRG